MPLDRFAREGQLLDVRVRWLGVPLWLVPEERDAEALGREGVGRGRIWTAREIGALMALPDQPPGIVQRLALAKRALDGDIVEVGRIVEHLQQARNCGRGREGLASRLRLQ